MMLMQILLATETKTKQWSTSTLPCPDMASSSCMLDAHSTGPPKLWTEIALSTTMSKFIGLSMGLCTTMPIMEMIKEIHK